LVLERRVTVLQDPSNPRVIYADGWMPKLWSPINGQRLTCLYTIHEKEVAWLKSCKVGGGPSSDSREVMRFPIFVVKSVSGSTVLKAVEG
jgi:hypothetical protein